MQAHVTRLTMLTNHAKATTRPSQSLVKVVVLPLSSTGITTSSTSALAGPALPTRDRPSNAPAAKRRMPSKAPVAPDVSEAGDGSACVDTPRAGSANSALPGASVTSTKQMVATASTPRPGPQKPDAHSAGRGRRPRGGLRESWRWWRFGRLSPDPAWHGFLFE